MDRQQSHVRSAEPMSTDQLKEEIRGTRQHIDQTMDSLGERLKPSNLIDEILDVWRGPHGNGPRRTEGLTRTADRARRALLGQVREHPLPSLLMGAGLIWWAFQAANAEQDDEDNDESRGQALRKGASRAAGLITRARNQVQEGTHQAGEKVGSAAGQAAAGIRGAASDLAESLHDEARRVGETTGKVAAGAVGTLQKTASDASATIKDGAAAASGKAAEVAQHVLDAAGNSWETAQHAGSVVSERAAEITETATDIARKGVRRARQGVHIAEERITEFVDDYPLAIAGACLAGGLLLGVALPRTRREDRLMGEASDHLIAKVKEKGEELVEHGKNIAAVTAASALEEAGASGLSVSELAEKAGHIVERVGETARTALHDEGLELPEVKKKVEKIAEKAVKTAEGELRKTAG